MNKVTQLLSAIEGGDPQAASQLLPLVYDELRKRDAGSMCREKHGRPRNGTALVHEAYVRLVGNEKQRSWHNRGHFYAAAAESMRRILVENARRKQSQQRGGGRMRLELDDELFATA